LFVLEARFSEPPRVGLPVKLGLMLLDFAGYPPDSSTVEARLILPQGWEVISGDTTYRGPIPRGELHWSLTVRPAHPGRYEIRRSVRIERGRFGVDEGEWKQGIDVRQDTTIVSRSEPARLETVRRGQRYRYGYLFLVPIDGPEEFTQDNLTDRASAVAGPPAICSACSTGDPTTVRWAVLTDRNGAILDVRLCDQVDPESPVATTTRQALRKWTFVPGRYRGRSVADWVIVKVPVARR
jgi:hypothetical protein